MNKSAMKRSAKPKSTATSAWEKLSENIVLGEMLKVHPKPRGVLIRDDKPSDPDSFEWVWRGTLDALMDARLIRKHEPNRPGLFRYFKLTDSGIRAARRRGIIIVIPEQPSRDKEE